MMELYVIDFVIPVMICSIYMPWCLLGVKLAGYCAQFSEKIFKAAASKLSLKKEKKKKAHW